MPAWDTLGVLSDECGMWSDECAVLYMVKEMNYILLVLLAVFAVVETRAQNEDSLKEKLVRLDECLQKKAEYDKAKENEIQKFRDALCRSRGEGRNMRLA